METQSEHVPKDMPACSGEITWLTDAFATHHLNDAYAHLGRRAAAALCRKRHSPLAEGKANMWACAMGMRWASSTFFPTNRKHRT